MERAYIALIIAKGAATVLVLLALWGIAGYIETL